ncbi:MAG: cation transporter [Syntrophomonadaceae bacterium]|nr:cation transporter [Syntrophomonadaceae bacterium]
MQDQRVRAAALSIFSNLLLVTMKVVAGIVTGSVSIISEAIHSANDLLASFIAFFAVKTASKPPDEQHPFGHGKIENISGTIEALLIFVAAVMIIVEAVGRLKHGGEVETIGLGLWAMGISALVNLVVSQHLLNVSKETDSIALEADGMHLRTDVYTSAGVFLGLLLIKVTGYTIIDPIVAILVALLIIKAAYDLTRKAFMPLMDTALSAEELEEIRLVLIEFEYQNVTYHDMRTRRSGRECHIDLHLEARPDMSIKEVHDICDKIERKIQERIPYSYVLIHVEPYEDSV